MKNLFKIIGFVLAVAFVSSCQKKVTASFNYHPSHSAYHDYSVDAKSPTEVPQMREEPSMLNQKTTAETQKDKPHDSELTPASPVVGQQEVVETPEAPTKMTKSERKSLVKKVRDLKKEMKSTKSSGDDKNRSLFLIILVVLLLALLIPGALYYVLVALLIWALLYLLGIV